MTTDFYEDWPHTDLRVKLVMSVNADELDELYEYIESSELSEYYSRVYKEMMDLLRFARRTIKDYQELRYRENETDRSKI